jgi:hypothetical protein
MGTDPTTTVFTAVALACAVGWTMVATAAKKRMIDLRGSRKRTCPSCGRVISGRVCKQH